VRLIYTNPSTMTLSGTGPPLGAFLGTVCTPRLRQLSANYGDAGGYPLRGAVMDAIDCYAPRVTFIVDAVDPTGTLPNALLGLRAQIQESVWGMDAQPSTVRTTDVSGQLIWGRGRISFDLSPYTVSIAALRLTAVSATAGLGVGIRVVVRVEVYSQEKPI